MCCRAENRQLTFYGISGSRCIWEDVIKRTNTCCFYSVEFRTTQEAQANTETLQYVQHNRAEQQISSHEGRNRKNLALCPGPPPPLFTFSFNKSLEDSCVPLIGHLHLLGFNEANYCQQIVVTSDGFAQTLNKVRKLLLAVDNCPLIWPETFTFWSGFPG